MEACSFDESNTMLDSPPGWTVEQCSPLSIIKLMDGDHPLVVSCWKVTEEELEEIKRTGRVWLSVYGTTMPPVALNGIKPFEVKELPDDV